MRLFVWTHSFAFSSENYGNSRLFPVGSCADLQCALSFFQTRCWLADPRFMILIVRVCNFVRFFRIDNERHRGLINIEALTWEEPTPFIIIRIAICSGSNPSLPSNAAPLHEIVPISLLRLISVSLPCTDANVESAQRCLYNVLSYDRRVITSLFPLN